MLALFVKVPTIWRPRIFRGFQIFWGSLATPLPALLRWSHGSTLVTRVINKTTVNK